MQFSRSAHIAIGISAFLALAASVAVSLFFLRPQQLSPADLLPATNVTAFFEPITLSSARIFTEELPQLITAPLTDAPSVLALVKDAAGNDGWILFSKQSVLGQPPYKVSASSPALLTLLSSTVSPLSADPAYRALITDDADTTMRVFLRFPELLQPQHPLFARFQPVNTPLSIAVGSGGVITIAWQATHEAEPLPFITPPAFASPIFTLSAGKGFDLFGSILRHMSNDDAVLARGVMAGLFQSVFGSNFSLTYDLAPLFLDAHTIQVAGTAESPLFLLRGTADDAEITLTKLHTFFALAQPQSVTQTHTFDDSFRMTEIRRAEESVRSEESRVNGWQVKQTQIGSGAVFVSGIKGDSFMMANESAAFYEALNAELHSPSSRSVVAHGTLAAERLPSFLSSLLPTIIPQNSALLFSLTGTPEWTLLKEGGVLSLRIEQ